MRHVFIINPAAGKVNRTEELTRQVQALSDEYRVDIIITEGVGDAVNKARAVVEDGTPARIYVCGGDGTANEVLTGIAGYDNCALGIIPVGSGNDFVRAMDGYKREDFLDVRRMLAGKERSIDLLECNGRYSMNILSIGFDAEIAKNVERFKRWPLVSGSLAYKISILYCLFSERRHPVRIQIDGEDFEKATYEKTTLLAVAANGKFYGGGIKAAPYAELSDGFIDFLHVSTVSVPRVLSLLMKYTKGTHLEGNKYPFLTYKRCKKLKYFAEEPIIVNLDGEMYLVKDPEINLLPNALRIIEPA